MNENEQVQAVRGVGSRRGYPYYAYGVYQPQRRRDGVLTYRLIRSGPWFRSDVNGTTAFDNIVHRPGIRHGAVVPNQRDAKGQPIG